MEKVIKLIVIGAVLLFAGIRLLAWGIRRRNHRKEMQRNAEDKLREEALDRVLTDGRKQEKVPANVPFDVKYDLERRKKNKPKEKGGVSEIMVQLTECSKLSTRKYMFHIAERITLGSKAGENDIVLTSARVSERQCELFRIGGELYVKNIGKPDAVHLLRGKLQTAVGREAIQLRNHDEIRVGDFSYQVTML